MVEEKSKDRSEIEDLKKRCPLPEMLKRLGLGEFAKSSCRSPLRKDDTPSWGIFEHEGKWFWKDHGTGEHGDEIDFLAEYLELDKESDFAGILKKYHKIAGLPQSTEDTTLMTDDSKPDRSGFSSGTDDQINRLAQLRQIRAEALKLAQLRGFLVFAHWHSQEVYGLTDQSGLVLEIRRLDGHQFSAAGSLPERKSHAVAGSKKKWPVGILEAKDHPIIVLVEGLPDFLAMFDFIEQEKKADLVAPVAMLGAANSIDENAQVHFRGKHVVIYPHADSSKAGLDAAEKWLNQLRDSGAKEVTIFDMTRVAALSFGKVKDLNDLLLFRTPEVAKNTPALSTILPNEN